MRNVARVAAARLFFFSFLLLALLLAGCGEAPAPEPERPAVDPRFATAEAMVGYFNALTTTTPVRFGELAENTYAENAVQKRMLKLVADSQPLLDLSMLVERQLGEPLLTKEQGFDLRPNNPATISSNGGQRAEAEFSERDGTPQTLYLVKLGDRWWFSGYSMEYATGAVTDLDDLGALDDLNSAAANVSKAFMARVRANEFSNVEECRGAWGLAVLGYIMQHPDRFQNMRRALELGRNPFGD